jgi:hypothetical protein
MSDLAPGILLLLVGIFLVTRTVTRDDTGRTLIDRALGNRKPGAGGSAALLGTGAADAGSSLAAALSTAGTKAADQARANAQPIPGQAHGGPAGP